MECIYSFKCGTLYATPVCECLTTPYSSLLSQFVKRDAILEIEKEVQLRWAKERVFELDAPKVHVHV